MSIEQMKLTELGEEDEGGKSERQDSKIPGEVRKLDEKDCIDIIREHGDAIMQKWLKEALQGNKYKIKKYENIWRDKFLKGKMLVRAIVRKKGRDVLEN